MSLSAKHPTNTHAVGQLNLLLVTLALVAAFFMPQSSWAATQAIGLVRQDCTGYSNCFTSLSSWQSNKGGISFGACASGDLVCADDIAIAQIDGSWTATDTSAVNITGWTTDAGHYIRIYTTGTARHSGKWDYTSYRLKVSASPFQINNVAYVQIDGLQIDDTRDAFTAEITLTNATSTQVSNNILRNGVYAIDAEGRAPGLLAWNNIINNEYGAGFFFNSNIASPSDYLYNNSIVSSTRGLRVNSAGGTYVLKNLLFGNNSITDFDNSGNCSGLTVRNNATTSSTLPCGTNNRTSQIFTFTASSTGDYHLDSSDASARSFGLDLSGDANLEFSTDIDGEYRSGQWDIGADQYVNRYQVQVSSRSDTLSDSRPSATSNHTIVFTTNTAVYGSSLSGSSTVVLGFDPSFTIPAGMDCGDVDEATSVQFNFNYPGCKATATAWGFTATGSVIALTPPSGTGVYVPTSTQVTINIGSNATVGQQGAHWITNPSSAGTYTISVYGGFNGSGNILLSLNVGVTVQATVAESLALTVSSVKAVNCSADDGATVTAIDTTSTTIPFGNVSLNTFYIGCQDLIVSTNAGNGYSITTQESSVMKTANGSFTVPDTTCDAGGCTESAAAAWTTVTKNGLGHTCFNQDGNHDCDASYTNGTKFRQFANIAAGETAQAIMSSTTPATVTARIKHRLSVGAAQAAGTYTTLITYTILGTF